MSEYGCMRMEPDQRKHVEGSDFLRRPIPSDDPEIHLGDVVNRHQEHVLKKKILINSPPRTVL